MTHIPDIPHLDANIRVVMLCGVSGSGKTTLAREFESRGWTRLSVDAIVNARLGDTYRRMSAGERRDAYMHAGAELTGRLPGLLAEGACVVIDASMCRRAKRDAVRGICARAGAGCALIYLTASRDELLLRLARRCGTGPDDQTVSPDELDGFLAGFEAPDPDENAYRISPE